MWSCQHAKITPEFREGVRRMTDNLELTLAALAGLELSNAHVRRAADQVKLSALRLLDLCRELPEALAGPGGLAA